MKDGEFYADYFVDVLNDFYMRRFGGDFPISHSNNRVDSVVFKRDYAVVFSVQGERVFADVSFGDKEDFTFFGREHDFLGKFSELTELILIRLKELNSKER